MSAARDGGTSRPRERILAAATDLLASGGRDAVTTRAVSASAAVQPATIYRQFGDMRGLLDAVAATGFELYLRQKLVRRRAADPVSDLRRGWDLHVEFGLANPATYALMFGDPRPGDRPPAALQADAVLRGLVSAVAAVGRLRLPVHEATRIISATGVGVVLALLAEDPSRRDQRLSDLTRDAVLDALTTASPGSRPATGKEPGGRRPVRVSELGQFAIATRERLGDSGDRLSAGERTLLSELLDRLS